MKFSQKLVLNHYMLSLFEVESIEELAKELKETRLEQIDENGQSLFFHRLTQNLFGNPNLKRDKLEEYDANIVRYTKELGRDIRWKYFQYLTLLFVEIYLDKFFTDRQGLLEELNTHLKLFNANIEARERVEPYSIQELNKLAFWNATGSGKTLLMHMNLKQFQHYAAGKMKINKTLLLTPKEGLSLQHLEEFEASKIEAAIFSKEQSLFHANAIEIIENTKLSDKDGDKTVAVDSFEENNLVFVDEAHGGSGGDTWKKNRDKLSRSGFSFEYSATFGQAINAATGTRKKELVNEYAKSILFDYSYKYFYNDGYGKDYTILNLNDDEERVRKTYLIASLLAFYQQYKIHEENPHLVKPYLIEKPLMIFVGGSVNAVRTDKGKKVSDIIDILLFIHNFLQDSSQSRQAITNLLSGNSGLLTKKGEDIFTNRFAYLASRNLSADTIYQDMLQKLFNTTSGLLHLDNFKSVDGEIGLRVGEGDYFGVINVGDANELEKLIEENGISIAKKEFSQSLFGSINDSTSSVNLLIGAKKFTEGWSSWRVSTMGLMNVGKSEGSQIIQLFGRGVRLKGKNFSLKRSRSYDSGLESKYQSVETINIFGLKADYMRQFKEYLEEEGVPTDERVEFILPVVKDQNIAARKLKIIKLNKDRDFKREVKLSLEYEQNFRIFRKVVLSRYKEVDMIQEGTVNNQQITLNEAKLNDNHLAFVSHDRLFFELQRYKNERNWFNLTITKDAIAELLAHNDWYKLFIPQAQLELTSFQSIQQFEEIVISLSKSYLKSFYEFKKGDWESQFLEYCELDENDSNLINEYKVTVEDKETELIERLRQLEEILKTRKCDEAKFTQLARNDFKAIVFGHHLYNPLIYKDSKLLSVQINPIQLNEGERDFIEDLKKYIEQNASKFNGIDLYLLRNQSKTGVGFFEAGNFYPDFIMWIVKDGKQYITFIDPKGLVNINTIDDPKINFSSTIKELESRLGDTGVILNSFIVSVTAYSVIYWTQETLEKPLLEEKNIVFQKDDRETYISKIFRNIGNII